MYTVKICRGGHGPGPPQSQKVQNFCEKGPGLLSRPPTGPAMHKICLIRVKLAIILLNISTQSLLLGFSCFIIILQLFLQLFSNFGNYFRQFMITFN